MTSETTIKEVSEATDKGIKAEETMDEATSIAGVKERLGFFFSNANVRQDAYLRKMLLKEDGSPGSVPIDALLRFNTIKTFTKEAAIVVKAAKELSDALVLSDDDTTISRKEPFKKDMLDGHIPLTLYLCNIPKTDEEKPSYTVKVDDVRKLFDAYGKVAMTKLRFSTCPEDQADYDLGIGGKRKEFKRKKAYPLGHAMVEFETQEDLDKAAAATLTTKGGQAQEPTNPLEIGETKLEVMLLSEYLAQRKEKKGTEDKEYEEKQSAKRKSGGGDDAADDANDEPPTFKYDWQPGCVIRLKGLPDTCDREALLEVVAKSLNISDTEVKDRKIYVDYSRGQTSGAIRFKEPSDDVGKVAEKLKSGEQTIQATKVTEVYVLEGDEEKAYWEKFIEFKTKQMRHKFEERNSKKHFKRRKRQRN